MLTPAELVWLIAAVAKGDEAAFERLYAATRAKLFGVVLRILRRQDLAEEVIQEAYVKIWHSAGQFNPALSSPITWMASIARNRAIDVVRFLVEEVAIKPRRLKASGFGSFRPVASTATEKGRAKTPRVAILLPPGRTPAVKGHVSHAPAAAATLAEAMVSRCSPPGSPIKTRPSIRPGMIALPAQSMVVAPSGAPWFNAAFPAATIFRPSTTRESPSP